MSGAMRVAVLLVLTLTLVAGQQNSTATSEEAEDDDSMSFFSLLEEVLNDSGTKYDEEPYRQEERQPPVERHEQDQPIREENGSYNYRNQQAPQIDRISNLPPSDDEYGSYQTSQQGYEKAPAKQSYVNSYDYREQPSDVPSQYEEKTEEKNPIVYEEDRVVPPSQQDIYRGENGHYNYRDDPVPIQLEDFVSTSRRPDEAKVDELITDSNEYVDFSIGAGKPDFQAPLIIRDTQSSAKYHESSPGQYGNYEQKQGEQKVNVEPERFEEVKKQESKFEPIHFSEETFSPIVVLSSTTTENLPPSTEKPKVTQSTTVKTTTPVAEKLTQKTMPPVPSTSTQRTAQTTPSTTARITTTESRNGEVDLQERDPSSLPLTYQRPGLYSVNNGQPFYLEKNPVTGDVDFGTKTVPAKTDADYFYDDTVDTEGIDRKDGKILTNNYDKNNPFNNLPLNYNDFNKVNDYQNHKYIDYPLISSSYANTKVQGTAGEKQTNHKPYVPPPPTTKPLYYTTRAKPVTTTTRYNSVTTTKPFGYGDKITKKPTERPNNNFYTKKTTTEVNYLPNENAYVEEVSRFNATAPITPEVNYNGNQDEYEEYEDSGAQASANVPVKQTTTTKSPLGNIVYAESPIRTSTFPAIVYSITTKKPEDTSRPIPNGDSTLTPFRPTAYETTTAKFDGVKTTQNVFVANSNVFSNGGGPQHPSQIAGGQNSQNNQNGQANTQGLNTFANNVDSNAAGTKVKESPYGIFSEEPFRPIYGPGDKLVTRLPVKPIPQETPNRWAYPNAPVHPDFFKIEVPKMPGVEPPRQTPSSFLKEPAKDPWNSQSFQVSSHVKFPSSSSSSIQVSDSVAEEAVDVSSFKRPAPQNGAQNSLIRGSVIPVRPGSAPNPGPANQRPNENGYLVREQQTYNVPLRVIGEGVDAAIAQGQSFDVPIGVSLHNGGAVPGAGTSVGVVQVAKPGVEPQNRPEISLQRPAGNFPLREEGELPNPPLREIPEGSIPPMETPAQELQPPKPGPWERPRPANFHRKPFNPNRRHGPDNLPNILPQFRPNAKTPHNENQRIGYFGPARQPLLDRPNRPVLEHLQPPSRIRNRNDNVEELYEKFPGPPTSLLHRPFVHRRAGPHVEGPGPHVPVTTLQMMQQNTRPVHANKIGKPDKPVFVVYPTKPSDADREVVVGIRGPHLPVPPSNLVDHNDDIIPYQHNKHQKPLLTPAKDRGDLPIIRLPTSRPPSKNEFPYPLVEPEEHREHAENEEGNTEVSKTSIDERIEAEVYNNSPIGSEGVDVVPYLQDYLPFATKASKPKDKPITVAESLWSLLGGNSEPRIVTKKEEPISVTLKTVKATTPKSEFRPGSESNVHQAVVGSEGSEFTLSAVMHTIPQANRDGGVRPGTVHSEKIPARKETVENQSFQAPFMASTNVDASPVSQGWNILSAGSTERKDVVAEKGEKTDSGEKTTFDFENFKPELFGGFKPIYTTENSVPKTSRSGEREEKKLT